MVRIKETREERQGKIRYKEMQGATMLATSMAKWGDMCIFPQHRGPL